MKRLFTGYFTVENVPDLYFKKNVFLSCKNKHLEVYLLGKFKRIRFLATFQLTHR